MTADVERRLQAVLDAIARAHVADKRLMLGKSLGDEVGIQIAYQAILHNVTVIGQVLAAVPADVLARDPRTSWSEFVALPGAIGDRYQRVVPDEIHQVVVSELGALDSAIRRLLAAG